jgi:Flp pilus assembly protein TadD
MEITLKFGLMSRFLSVVLLVCAVAAQQTQQTCSAEAEAAITFAKSQKQWETQLAPALKALDKDPTSAQGYFSLAVGFTQKGVMKDDAAKRDNFVQELCWQAIALDNNFGEAKNAILDIADAYMRTGTEKYENAFALYERLAKADPTDATPYFGLSSYYQVTGQPEKAYETIGKAAELAPEDDEVYSAMAIIEMAQNNVEGAVETLQEAIKFAPATAAYHARLAMAQGQLGNLGEAEEAAAKAVELDSGNEESKALLQKIRTHRAGSTPVASTMEDAAAEEEEEEGVSM